MDGAGDGDGVVDVDDASPGASALGERVDGVDDEVGAVDDAEPHPMRATATSIASATPSNRSEPVFRRVLMTRLYGRQRPLPCRA